MRGWQEACWAGLLLLALSVLFFWPQVAGGRILYWGDIGLYFLPMTAFLRDNLRMGHLPLWNPLLLCGTPFVGNPQTWPAYPLSWLLPFVPAGYFLNLMVALHVWLASWGTFLFLRRAEGLGARASLVGAIVFGFGGQLISKEQFPNMVQAIAWLPLVLLGAYSLFARWRVRDAVRLGLALGLQLLAAHAQMTLLTLYLGAAYGAMQWVKIRPRPALRLAAARLALAGAIALGLCAVQVLPTLELYQNAWRQKLSFHVVNRFCLPANQLANFVLPTRHGHPFWGNFSARGNFWETCCYLSVVGFALALAGSAWAWRGGGNASMRFWAGTAIIGAWLATGGAGGLYRAAYSVLPGFRSFHDPARCLVWSAWGLSLLAGYGYERCQMRVLRPHAQRALFAGCLLLVFGDLLHFGRMLYPLTVPHLLAGPAPIALADQAEFDAHQARILAPDSARTWQRFTAHQSFRQNDPNYLPLWMDTMTPNLPMLGGLPDAYGYEPMTRRDAQTVAGAAADDLRPGASGAQREIAMAWAGMLGVRTVIFFRARPPQQTIAHAQTLQRIETLPALGKAADLTRVFVCRNELWQPRARLTTRFVSVPTRAAAFALLSRAALGPSSFNLAAAAIVVGQPGFASRPGHGDAPAPIVGDTPDRVVVQADTQSPALLVLADTLHPGWRALVDGRPAPMLSADGFLRAVPLPAMGRHTVAFDYKPTSFLLGAYLSLLTAGGLAAFFARWAAKNAVFFRRGQEIRRYAWNKGG